MSRKRFVKLVMAHGIQRNQAVTIAVLYCNRGYSYKEAYRDFLIKRGLSLSINRISNAFNMLASNLKSATTAAKKLKETLSNNLRSELMNDRSAETGKA